MKAVKKGLGIQDININLVKDTFILIGSETPLANPYHFHQDGFREKFGKVIPYDDFHKFKGDINLDDDLELDWIINEGAVKHNVPVLFLCNGTEKGKIGQLKARSEVTLLAYEYFNDGEDDWICGLMDIA